MISFDRLRRETDEISTKYNRGQKPVGKRGRPRGGSLCVPNVGHRRLVFEKIHEEPSEKREKGDRSRCTTDSPSRGRDRAWVETRVATSGLSIDLLNDDIERKYFFASFLMLKKYMIIAIPFRD